MDRLDRAADAALAYQGAPDLLADRNPRPLLPSAFEALVEHLRGTTMTVTDACRALRLVVLRLTLDDLDRLGARLSRCDRCGTWLAQGDTDCPGCTAAAEEHWDE